MKQCPQCGSQTNNGSRFCVKCGYRFPQRAVCPQCGAPIDTGSKFCTNCGCHLTGHGTAATPAPPQAPQAYSPTPGPTPPLGSYTSPATPGPAAPTNYAPTVQPPGSIHHQPVPVTGKQCPRCGATVKDGNRFCVKCGFRFQQREACPQCGAPLSGGETFCVHCGCNLASHVSAPAPTAQTPVPTASVPTPTAQTLEPTAQTPAPTAQTPAPTAQTPEPTASAPTPTASAPEPTAQTPEPAPEPPAQQHTPEPPTTTPDAAVHQPGANHSTGNQTTTTPACCPHCGMPMGKDSKFCTHCGKRVLDADVEQAPAVEHQEPASAPPAPTPSATTMPAHTSEPMDAQETDVHEAEPIDTEPGLNTDTNHPADADGGTDTMPTAGASCPHCGMPMEEDTKFCIHCGKRVHDADEAEAEQAPDEKTSPEGNSDADHLSDQDQNPEPDSDLSQPQPTTEQSEPYIETKSRSIWPFVALLVVGLLIGGGIYWYMQNMKNPGQADAPSTAQVENMDYQLSDSTLCHYTGPVVDGKPHGIGKLTFDDGAVYVGPFADGIMEGPDGHYTSQDYSIDSLTMHNNEPASGIMRWPDGARFVGTFRDWDIYDGTYTDAKGNQQTITKGK